VRIGVISDSHGDKYSIDRAIFHLKHCDIIYHLGDKCDDVNYLAKKINIPIKGVTGNCDRAKNGVEELIEEVDKIRILLTHGHNYGVYFNTFKLRLKALEENCNIVLYGHTHVGKIEQEEGIYYINPGSTSEPRGGTSRSIAIIEVIDNKINPQIINI
jgi:putative phosphoesterase